MSQRINLIFSGMGLSGPLQAEIKERRDENNLQLFPAEAWRALRAFFVVHAGGKTSSIF